MGRHDAGRRGLRRQPQLLQPRGRRAPYYGYRHVIPTHQGRGAEHILSQICIAPGDTVPGNMYFTTTRYHQEHAGGAFVDVIVDEAHDPASLHPFKGNVDLDKLEAVLKTAKRVPYLSLAATVNMAGGQPVSMANAKAVRALCDRYGVPVMMDATRAVENAYFIQQREPGYAGRSVADILKEFCSYTDGCTMSGKKDALVNIGGWLALNDDGLADKARNMVVVYEGLHTYGGMAGRDMEAMARGIVESVQDDHIRARVGQVEYLGELADRVGHPDRACLSAGTRSIWTRGGSTPTCRRSSFPAQMLAAELYLDSGVRAMERGIVSAGRNKETGDHYYPKLELVRLTIPRRVYTQAHMDVVAESVEAVYRNPDKPKGLKMVYEPEYLRFFQARFERL